MQFLAVRNVAGILWHVHIATGFLVIDSLRWWFPDLSVHKVLEGLFPCKLLNLPARISVSVALKWDLLICLFDKFPVVPRVFWEHHFKKP